ncbi:dephospho-CoA kinase [Euzebya tangerina]|uniref:dephospho-CoA kinase n=1 Tax=Euzebya tangerina TaxID=591198 RepID=UPI000E3150C1|nr:dephospho-CoA kinase [Euzebya tangerina]
MQLIGLTGGIASGKSTVSSRLRKVHGWAVVDADRVARDIVEPGQPALAEIAEHFAPDVITDDGTLDRARLGAIVFADDDSRQTLNQITHPRIAEEMALRIHALADHPKPVVVDSPLLVEMGHAENYPTIIVVVADPETQHRRLVDHRAMDPDEAWGRINAQASNDERRAVATHVLDNSGSIPDLHDAVDRLVAAITADPR